jgi:CheY-like chemotaxis protein
MAEPTRQGSHGNRGRFARGTDNVEGGSGAGGKADRSPAEAGAASRPLEGRGETLLLVEDEPAILRLATGMLERFGYKVLGAGHASEALEIAAHYEGKIDLLVTDVVMPDMNGKQLAERVLTLRPGIKRLYMSGYAMGLLTREDLNREGVFFLQKPFGGEELAAKVREALDS